MSPPTTPSEHDPGARPPHTARTPTGRTDEVDAIVAAWRHERPDLHVDVMHVLSRVHRLSMVLDAARKDAYAAHGLELWEFDVLAALRRAGAPYRLSPGQLVRQTHVTSGTMTNRVDRLTQRGLVARMSDPDDGRGVIVMLTSAGKSLVDAALGDLLVAEERLLTALTPAQQDDLADLLRIVLLSTEPDGPSR